MKKFVILFALFLISLPALAFENIEYNNIKPETKIKYDGTFWSTKVDKKQDTYFIKQIPGGSLSYSEYYTKDGNFLFSTGTQYEFIHDGRLIGYSNNDLKFYEFMFENDILQQRELSEDDIKQLFPKFEVVKITDFTSATNSYKVKKKQRKMNLILVNDTDRYFDNYAFTSNNVKYENYNLKGLLKIKSKGMIQFARFGENTKNYPWYILLIR